MNMNTHTVALINRILTVAIAFLASLVLANTLNAVTSEQVQDVGSAVTSAVSILAPQAAPWIAAAFGIGASVVAMIERNRARGAMDTVTGAIDTMEDGAARRTVKRRVRELSKRWPSEAAEIDKSLKRMGTLREGRDSGGGATP